MSLCPAGCVPLSPHPQCHLHPLLPVLPLHGDRELPWTCSGLGLPGCSSACVLAQCEQMNLNSSLAREPRGVPTSHRFWGAGTIQGDSVEGCTRPAQLLPHTQSVRGVTQGIARLCCADTQRQWSLSLPSPLPAPLGSSCASPRAALHPEAAGEAEVLGSSGCTYDKSRVWGHCLTLLLAMSRRGNGSASP